MEFYDCKIKKNSGEDLNLSKFRGKKLMIVNVASECGYTPQYEQLEELYQGFKDSLEIIAIPCNDFGGQEPGDAETIKNFCKVNYGVNFTITEKVGILQNTHAIYLYLKKMAEQKEIQANVDWNFCKYLLDETGHITHFLPSSILPVDELVIDWLEN